MIKEILFASTNKGKIAEIREVAKEYSQLVVLGLNDLIDKLGQPPEVEENGLTYEANAATKGRAYHKWSGMAALADDAGVEVDSLGGSPGIYSARYANNSLPGAYQDHENRIKLLKELDGTDNRRAKFICCLHLILNDGREFTANGIVHGQIALAASGNGGFGYDHIFIPEGYTDTLSTLKERRVPIDTHRKLATKLLLAHLRSNGVI